MVIGEGGNAASIPLLELTFDNIVDPQRRIMIALAVAKLGNRKLALSMLKNALDGLDRRKKLNAAWAIYDCLEICGAMIFEDYGGKWEVVEMPERYTF